MPTRGGTTCGNKRHARQTGVSTGIRQPTNKAQKRAKRKRTREFGCAFGTYTRVSKTTHFGRDVFKLTAATPGSMAATYVSCNAPQQTCYCLAQGFVVCVGFFCLFRPGVLFLQVVLSRRGVCVVLFKVCFVCSVRVLFCLLYVLFLRCCVALICLFCFDGCLFSVCGFCVVA